MKKLFFYLAGFFLVALILCRFVIGQMRWSDKKAYRVFAARQVPLSIHDTLIDGRHLHYAATGPDSLPTLIFVHGSPGSWFHYMKFMWDSALRCRFRMISVDRPGFGYSDFGMPLHLQEQCSLLLRLLRTFKKDKPLFLCGHSYGGPVVVKLAADAPDLFKTIVVASGAIDPDLEEHETWRHLMAYKPLFWYLPGAFQPSNTEILWIKQDLRELAPDFSRVTCNVLFLHGDRDSWVPIGNVAYGIKMLNHAVSVRVDTFHDANHQIPWNRKEDFQKILMTLE